MSTILKALKKLEQEKGTRQPSRPTPVFSSPDTTAGKEGGWLRNPWIKNSALGLAILILGLSTWYYYIRSRPNGPRPSIRNQASLETGSKNKVPANPIRPNTRPEDQHTAIKQPPARQAAQEPKMVGRPHTQGAGGGLPTDPKRVATNRNIEPGAASSVSREGKISDYSQPVAIVSPGENTPGAVGPDRSRDVPMRSKGAANPGNPRVTVQKKLPAHTAADRSGSDRPQKAPVNEYANTPRLTDGRLKVHAIAWSAEAEERMAVVNSRVVHEGDSIDGFLIVAIRPEDVVVREKENGMFRVVFGHP